MRPVSKLGAYLTPLMVVALSFGYAVGWGSFVMPGTVFLPGAGPAGTVIGMLLGAVAIVVFAFNYHWMLQRVPGPGGTPAISTTLRMSAPPLSASVTEHVFCSSAMKIRGWNIPPARNAVICLW